MQEDEDPLKGFKHSYDADRDVFVLEVDAALLRNRSSETVLVGKMVEILKNRPCIQGVEAKPQK